MKNFFVVAVLLFSSVIGVVAQENIFSKEEQEIINLSNNKWQWMSDKNVEKLADLFHETSQFVHMGGYWGKEQELNTIKDGGIWYKKAEIHDQKVKFTDNTATVYSVIHLNSEVGGNAVRFPFIVTEVYVRENGNWLLTSLVFTRTLGE
ncbi:MAG: nuclear transport factor 2 family protein [Bacteroides sp.]|nr:nuclear transport factor 2 family protein [Roseburia sp.]MCM1345830.1 nuclear transport factor 2 family protein [Bacteroides sp.]MCM1420220.1 nuclear transport factor 2 family protein [Bacteroides sp.]